MYILSAYTKLREGCSLGRKPRKRARLPDLLLDPDALPGIEYRSKQINLRLTPTELKTIREMAKELKVSVSDYVVGLHLQAVKARSRKKRK